MVVSPLRRALDGGKDVEVVVWLPVELWFTVVTGGALEEVM